MLTREPMATSSKDTVVADRFAFVAGRFCSTVESAPSLEREAFIMQVYRALPKLIDEAIGLPHVEPTDAEGTFVTVWKRMEHWNRLYTSLKEKLGEWDPYRQVFDPTHDTESVHGSLADDLADIYMDLKEGLVLREINRSRPQDLIWNWRLSFDSHWGKHAIDALHAIHFRLQGNHY